VVELARRKKPKGMLKLWKRYRVFEGKKYKLYRTYDTKQAAKIAAKAVRQAGYWEGPGRVVPGKNARVVSLKEERVVSMAPWHGPHKYAVYTKKRTGPKARRGRS
jgi:hypothetical protein